MCVAIPGKLISIDGNYGMASFGGTEMKVNLSMVDAEIGQYVLVHAGCAIEVMAEDQAAELLSIFGELDTL